jgi:hypothetical protein
MLGAVAGGAGRRRGGGWCTVLSGVAAALLEGVVLSGCMGAGLHTRTWQMGPGTQSGPEHCVQEQCAAAGQLPGCTWRRLSSCCTELTKR